MKNKTGFSLFEIIIAMAFMSVALLSMFWMNQASSRGSMDAYYELLAFSLAKEPIEVFRGLGYDSAAQVVGNKSLAPKEYKIGSFDVVKDHYPVLYPFEVNNFVRKIELEKKTVGKINAVEVTVTVAKVSASRASKWLRRDNIVLKGLVVEQAR